MKMYTKLFIAGIIFFLLSAFARMLFVIPFSALCFIGGFILLIVQGITEITNKEKTPNKKDYDEARRAYEEVIKKQKQHTKAPWEE